MHPKRLPHCADARALKGDGEVARGGTQEYEALDARHIHPAKTTAPDWPLPHLHFTPVKRFAA